MLSNTIMVKCICARCGDPFERSKVSVKSMQKRRPNAKTYCGNSCRGNSREYQTAITKCQYCGTEESQTVVNKFKRKFCSIRCYSKAGKPAWVREKISITVSERARTHGGVGAGMGRFHSEKNEQSVFHRSLLELRYYQFLEDYDYVIGYYPEPLGLPYLFEGNWHTYNPDVIVVYDDRIELQEVKSYFHAHEPCHYKDKQKNLAKWKYAEKYIIRDEDLDAFRIVYEEGKNNWVTKSRSELAYTGTCIGNA